MISLINSLSWVKVVLDETSTISPDDILLRLNQYKQTSEKKETIRKASYGTNSTIAGSSGKRKDSDSAKREYLNAKSNNIKLESCINETREMNKKLMNDMDSLQRMYSDCKSEMRELRFTVQSQSGLILELQDRISDLEYDNVRLKQKLKIHDEVAKRSKVVVPFKATI